MSSSSQKRSSAEQAGSEERKRARIQPNEGTVIDLTEDSNTITEPSTPTVGKKRSSTDLEDDKVDDQKLTVDSRAIYLANQKEIDEWYDEEYSLKLGIPRHHKVKHSKDPWYWKIAAWMKHVGLVQSPKKKRKLNNGTAKSAEDAQSRTKRPHEVQYPADLVNVPEFPFDKLEDYEKMPTGNYACLHTNRNPPLDCCKSGMDKAGKLQAIKKSIEVWRKNVERLIDERQLDEKHKTWTNWKTPKLRAKYQPQLYKQQEEKKAGKVRRQREEERQRREAQKHTIVPAQSVHRQLTQQRPTQQYPAPAMRSRHHPPAYPAPSLTPKLPGNSHLSCAAPALQRQSITASLEATQTSFLTSLALTNPRLLRAHNALYHDAQYRESQKETPDFGLLKTWYLAYFLKEKKQPLSAEQEKVLKGGDPSYGGRKRSGGGIGLERVGGLFDEFLRAAKMERDAECVKHESLRLSGSVEEAGVQASRISSRASLQAFPQTLRQQASAPILRAQSFPPAAQVSDDSYRETGTAQAVGFGYHTVPHVSVDIWDHDTINSALDHILAKRPIISTQPVAWPAQSAPQQMTPLRSGLSYLTSLPQSFTTGNEAVNDEVVKLLEYAYRTDSMTLQHTAEDEWLLCKVVEDTKRDWQLYRDFYGEESNRSAQPHQFGVFTTPEATAQAEPVAGFHFGEPFREDQLAVLDFDDPMGQAPFGQLGARVTAAHAANLARYRRMT